MTLENVKKKTFTEKVVIYRKNHAMSVQTFKCDELKHEYHKISMLNIAQ